MNTKFITGIAFSLSISGCIKNASETKNTLQYGHNGTELPLKWALAGVTKSECKTNADASVPRNLVDDINVAWTEANKLLYIPMEALANQSGGDFVLNTVSLVLGAERVFVLNGCLGLTGKTASNAVATQITQITPKKTYTESITSSCEELSPAVAELKQPEVMKPTNNCGSPNLVAGFAMRSTARDINLTAHFTIKGSTRAVAMAPFEVNTLEIQSNASASISSFGAALLPLPPAIKSAAAAVLDRIGSAAISASAGTVNTVLPDNAFRSVPHPSGNGSMRVSRLAEKIAAGILQPICKEAQQKIGGFNMDQCELRSVKGEFGTVDAIELYKKIPVVNCESKGIGDKYLYALARKPIPNSQEPDFLTNASNNPTKLSVYHKNTGPTAGYAYKSWSTYVGVAKDPQKCGAFDATDLRCIVVVSGGTGDGMGQCGSQVNRVLSLLTAATLD